MANLTNKQLAAVFSAIGATIGYGVTPVFLRYFVSYLDPWTVNGLRYGVAALFWLPVVLISMRRPNSHPHGKSIWRAALVPSLINTAGQIGWGISPYLISAPMMGFAYRLSFLFTVLLGLMFIRQERPLLRQSSFGWGSLLCVIGVVGMFWDNITAGFATSAAAIALVIVTNFMFGGYAVSVRRCMEGFNIVYSFGVISIYTALILIGLMFAVGNYQRAAHLNNPQWLMLIISALIGIAISHVLYYHSIHGLGAIISTGLMMSMPFITAAVAALFLREILTLPQVIGGVILVFGGILLVIARGRVEPQATESPDI